MDLDERDFISQAALLKHRQAILAGGRLQEYVPVTAILDAPRLDAEEVVRCKDCVWFLATGYKAENVDASSPDCRRGFCICWQGETRGDQYCSRGKPKR